MYLTTKITSHGSSSLLSNESDITRIPGDVLFWVSVMGVTRYGDTRGYQGWYSLLGYCGTRFRAVLRSRHSNHTESNCIGRVYE